MQDLSTTPSSTVSSYRGTTPGTALTQPSPDGLQCTCIPVRSAQKVGHSSHVSPLSKDRQGSGKLHSSNTASLGDYAAAPSYPKFPAESIKLSATAVPFTPRNSTLGHNTSSHDSNTQALSIRSLTNAAVQGSSLNDPFFNQEQRTPSLAVTRARIFATQEGDGVVGQKNTSVYATVDLSHASRYVQVDSVPKNLEIDELGVALNNKTFGPPNLVILTELASSGTIYLHFTDIRDARAAFVELRQLYPCWTFSFISRSRFIDIHRPEQDIRQDATEARVIAKAVCDGPREAFDVRQVSSMVQDFLTSFGELLSWNVSSADFPELEINVEYYDTVSAQNALRTNPFKQAGITLVLRVPQDATLGQQYGAGSRTPRAAHNELSSSTNGMASSFSCPSMHPYHGGSVAMHGPSMLARAVRSVSLPSHVSYENLDSLASSPILPALSDSRHWFRPQESFEGPSSNGVIVNRPSREVTPKAFRRQNESSAVHQNVVDIDRIRLGSDVRTTVMLRNIPNKITQAMLKEMLDKTSYGKYDFMYLRIDFANNCNVGYAFINFEDPWHIIDFVKARAGRRWNCFNSDKVAEVSYATIQGKECLIQKFRNSSVMMEHPTFRPKIFRTGSGPDAGQEEKFPGPDNSSKMRRSVENAEHVGLFAPRGVHQHRDDQRRRSRYDLGTHFAELDIASSDDSLIPPMARMPPNRPPLGPPFPSTRLGQMERRPGSFSY